MVIMGADDNIVSNELVASAMKQLCSDNPVSKVVLSGSGHYIQDLQYHYLRWLLTEFLEKRQSPSRTARISVEMLGCSSSNGPERRDSSSADLLAPAQ
jgi:hypothetical protein